MMEINSNNAEVLLKARSSVDGYPKDFKKLWEEVYKYAESENRKAYVGLHGNQIVGYVECKLKENDLPENAPQIHGLEMTGHVARIGVHERFRGKGFGKSLLSQAELWLRSRERAGAWLDFYFRNTAARKLYTRSGYKVVASFTDGRKDSTRSIALKKW